MYRQWVPCERNSSYNFIPIFLKLCTCFLHGLKMCIWFGYNPCINFCRFFLFANFVIHFLTSDCMKVLWQWVPCERSSYTILYKLFWNFAHIFPIVWRYACNLDIILELIFCHFFYFVNFVIFWPQMLWKYRDSRYLMSAASHTILYWSFWNFAHLFYHGLKMCMWFGFICS